MSNVTLRIGGRNYTVATAPGEEDHISGLGQLIDSRIASMEGLSGQSESRMLLFAALLLADDLHEARSKPSEAGQKAGLDLSGLDVIARRLENLALQLEGGQTNA